MTGSGRVWRPAARRDVVELAAYYAAEGGVVLEVGFLDALEATLDLITRHPYSGATRHADLFPELPAKLRFHPLRRFERILVYYTSVSGRVEIIRVWNAARGLDALLDDSNND